MGPLTTQGFLMGEWGLVVAFLLGIAFGFVLEQAGFSTSRKLAGVFYGYDFVVLRVFFTAAITAMVGLLFFNYFGIIDLSQIFVNPIFLWSSIIGGVIMGLGFIIGGFCPGTSICAIGIGKIDAMVFIVGIFLGVFIFGEAYPIFENLHKAKGVFKSEVSGAMTINDVLGISAGVFALILIVVALIAFYVTTLIENKIKKVDY